MDVILGALLQLIFEIAAQVILECIVQFGWDVLKRPILKTRRPLLLAFTTFAAGVAVGSLSLIVLPRRLVPPSPLPGVSLVLSPIGTGLAVQWIGDRSRARGNAPMLLSFWPGAAFALGVALVRFVYPIWFR